MVAYIYHFIAYKILYLSIYFVLKRNLSIVIYTGTFLEMAIDLSFHFQNYKHIQEYFGFYLLITVYTKKQY